MHQRVAMTYGSCSATQSRILHNIPIIFLSTIHHRISREMFLFQLIQAYDAKPLHIVYPLIRHYSFYSSPSNVKSMNLRVTELVN